MDAKQTPLDFTRKQLQDMDELIAAYESCLTNIMTCIEYFRRKIKKIENYQKTSKLRPTGFVGNTLCVGAFVVSILGAPIAIPAVLVATGATASIISTKGNARNTDRWIKEMEQYYDTFAGRMGRLNHLLERIAEIVEKFEKCRVAETRALAHAVVKVTESLTISAPQWVKLKGGFITTASKVPVSPSDVGAVIAYGATVYVANRVAPYVKASVKNWWNSGTSQNIRAPSTSRNLREDSTGSSGRTKVRAKKEPTQEQLARQAERQLLSHGSLEVATQGINDYTRDWGSNNAALYYATQKVAHLMPLAICFQEILVKLQRVKAIQELRVRRKVCSCLPVQLSVFYVNIQSTSPGQKNQAKVACLKEHIAKFKPDIVAIVETWLQDTGETSDEILKGTYGLEGYILCRHHRRDASDPVERVRRGGGFLVAYNVASMTSMGFKFEAEPQLSTDSSRHFTISRYFNCARCPRTGVPGHGVGSGWKSYSFVVHYRRPGPFRATWKLPAEKRKDYLAKDAAATSHLFNSFPATNAGAVIVGDFNWTEQQWTENVGHFRSGGNGWTRVISGQSEHTARDGTNPDGVLVLPTDLAYFPLFQVSDMETVHNALSFGLHFGRDFDPNQARACEECIS